MTKNKRLVTVLYKLAEDEESLTGDRLIGQPAEFLPDDQWGEIHGAAGQHFQHRVGCDGLAVQLVAGAADMDRPGIVERAVFDDRVAGKVDCAGHGIGDGATVDRRIVQRRR